MAEEVTGNRKLAQAGWEFLKKERLKTWLPTIPMRRQTGVQLKKSLCLHKKFSEDQKTKRKG